jgi:uncharacterized protein (TIGR02611 family)
MGTEQVTAPPGRRVTEMSEAVSPPPPASPGRGAEPADGVLGRLHAVLEAIRANPTGRIALKVTIGVLGGLIVALGIALIPLPGPGWAIVILGLAIWALEFHWAKRLLGFTRWHVRAWTAWATRQSLPVRFVIGLFGFVFISAVVWVSVKLSLGIDLAAVPLDWIGTR